MLRVATKQHNSICDVCTHRTHLQAAVELTQVVVLIEPLFREAC